MKKYIFVLLFVCLFILCINSRGMTAEFKEYPNEIELLTEIKNASSISIEEYIYSIIIKDITPANLLKICFHSRKKDEMYYINQHIKIKYRINQNSDWKEWNNIIKPLEISFESFECIQDVKVELKFFVPQSIQIRGGTYSGMLSFCLS